MTYTKPQIEEMLAGITPGEGKVYISKDARDHSIYYGNRKITEVINYDRALEHSNRLQDENNARLIASSPLLVRELLDENTRLSEKLEMAEEALIEIDGTPPLRKREHRRIAEEALKKLRGEK